MATNVFDAYIISFFNQLAHLPWAFFNKCFFLTEESELLHLLPLAMALWWAWFRGGDRTEDDRKAVATILIAFVVIVLFFAFHRHICCWIGVRPRPMFNPQSNFQMPFGVPLPRADCYWARSSTFPSGHAAYLAVFSVGLMYISRLAGILCVIHSTLICLGRIYFGIHYPTDMIGGACLGIAVFYLTRMPLVERSLTRRMVEWSDHRPYTFYPFFFFLTYNLGAGFRDLKDLMCVAKDFVVECTKLWR